MSKTELREASSSVNLGKGRAMRALTTFVVVSMIMTPFAGEVIACDLPAARPLKVRSLEREAIDTQRYIRGVVSALGDDYMGYSALLAGKAGKIIASAKYGFAQSPCESAGGKVFNHKTQVNWGSVTKILTTALVIDKIERSRRSLDDKFWRSLPSDWREEMRREESPHMEVRIRDLLSHKSGFAGSSDLSHRQRVTASTLEKPLNRRVYANANFGIFIYMGRFFRRSYFDELEAGFHSSEIPKDSYLSGLGISIYKRAMQRRIAGKLGIKFSCNDADYNGPNFARYYDGPSGKKGFLLTPADYHGCTTGGIVMSPKDMITFLRALTQTDKIITRRNYENEMAISSEGRLGWDYAVPTVDGYAFGKAGARGFGNSTIVGNPPGAMYAEIVALPHALSALIVANSGRPSGGTRFRRIMISSYEASVAP